MSALPTLSFAECRVLGSLIEKAMTTPEYYPLTFNALHAACNQKSNRDPVMAFDQKTVARAIEDLRAKHLAWEVTVTGNRVPKYRHDFSGQCPATPEELAVLAELLLRGAQTAAELRTRAARMAAYADAAAMEAVLQALAGRPEPLVVKLPPAPGQREPRFAHKLGADIPSAPTPTPVATPLTPVAAIADVRAENERLEALERSVAQLQAELAELKAQLAGLLG